MKKITAQNPQNNKDINIFGIVAWLAVPRWTGIFKTWPQIMHSCSLHLRRRRENWLSGYIENSAEGHERPRFNNCFLGCKFKKYWAHNHTQHNMQWNVFYECPVPENRINIKTEIAYIEIENKIYNIKERWQKMYELHVV